MNDPKTMPDLWLELLHLGKDFIQLHKQNHIENYGVVKKLSSKVGNTPESRCSNTQSQYVPCISPQDADEADAERFVYGPKLEPACLGCRRWHPDALTHKRFQERPPKTNLNTFSHLYERLKRL